MYVPLNALLIWCSHYEFDRPNLSENSNKGSMATPRASKASKVDRETLKFQQKNAHKYES